MQIHVQIVWWIEKPNTSVTKKSTFPSVKMQNIGETYIYNFRRAIRNALWNNFQVKNFFILQ